MESPLAVSACSACSAGCVCLLPSLPAMPTALNVLAPIQQFAPSIPLCFACHLFLPCAPGSAVCQGQQFASCKTVPLAAATRACSGGPCTGPFFLLTYLFPAESMILGHGSSVEFRLSCLYCKYVCIPRHVLCLSPAM